MAYTIQEIDVPRAAEVLSAAFAEYPIFRYVVPESTGRTRMLAQVFRFLVRLGLATGEVLAPSDRIEGVSIWVRSERAGGATLAAFQAGLLGLYLRAGHGVVARLLQVAATKSRARAELLTEPYCLLDMIGVEPSLQGRGLARTILEDKLRELDSEHLPCYLETSRITTARYYERFGFELIRQYRLATLDVFCLLRKVGAPEVQPAPTGGPDSPYGAARPESSCLGAAPACWRMDGTVVSSSSRRSKLRGLATC